MCCGMLPAADDQDEKKKKLLAEIEARAEKTEEVRKIREHLGQIQAFLENANWIEVYQLNPDRSKKPGNATFHTYEILRKVRLEKSDKCKDLGTDLGKTFHWNKLRQMLCFSPRHGLKAVQGKDTLNLVICFQCNRINVYKNNESHETITLLDNKSAILEGILGEKMPKLALTPKHASAFAALALKGIQKEFPNKPGHVWNDSADAKTPRELHPAFYGCFDWHSSVHGHWMLVRILRLFPDLPESKRIRAVLAEHLTAKNLKAEAAYFGRPHARSFERTYGWAWLLKLAEELHGWDDSDAKKWSKNLQPLTDVIVARYLAFLPKQTYPIRTGVHPNTAFGLAFALDYARAVGHKDLCELIEERSRTYYGKDVQAPARWEPDGADFFSPSLLEADLMRRVLKPAEFRAWFHRYLPGIARGEPKNLLMPATVSDRTDPLLAHLDGLNLSRPWCMRNIAAALPKDYPARKVLAESAARHAKEALNHVATGDYAGEHWLASFATYMLSTPSPD